MGLQHVRLEARAVAAARRKRGRERSRFAIRGGRPATHQSGAPYSPDGVIARRASPSGAGLVLISGFCPWAILGSSRNNYMKSSTLLTWVLAALPLFGSIVRGADNMASLAITPATGVVTLTPRWAIGANQAGFHHMSQDLGLTGSV